MRLLINESQEKTLYKYLLKEYGGYVSGFERTINYIYDKISKTVNSLLAKDKDIIAKLLAKYDKDDDLFNIIPPLVIDEQTLNKLGIKNVKRLEINYFVSKGNTGGAFNSNATDIDEDNKFNRIQLYLNIGYTIESNMKNLKEMLQHELTHAYQILRMYREKGVDNTYNNFNNKYYTSDIEKNNLPHIFSYKFSKIELNAYISELYTVLKESNANLTNYKDIVRESTIYQTYRLLIDIEKAFKGNNRIKQTEKVMQWINENPEHVDMFPSSKGMTVERYNKRLIAMCNDKLTYIYDKIRKITERYLMDIQKKGE